jgi:hypothetical protein
MGRDTHPIGDDVRISRASSRSRRPCCGGRRRRRRSPTSLNERLAAAVGDRGPECGEIGWTVELLVPELVACEGRTEEPAFV